MFASLIVGACVVTLPEVTSGAYNDIANALMGNAGAVGNPNAFSVEASNGDGVWKAADTEAEAVVMAMPAGQRLSPTTPLVQSVSFRVGPSSPAGDVLPSLVPPADCVGTCIELFNSLLFTVSYDGQPTLASAVSAATFNAMTARGLAAVPAGEVHQLNLSVLLVDGLEYTQFNGVSTRIAVLLSGTSRA